MHKTLYNISTRGTMPAGAHGKTKHYKFSENFCKAFFNFICNHRLRDRPSALCQIGVDGRSDGTLQYTMPLAAYCCQRRSKTSYHVEINRWCFKYRRLLLAYSVFVNAAIHQESNEIELFTGLIVFLCL